MNEQKRIAELEQQIVDLNDRLVEVENSRSLFISNMLNEVNNPLTSILGLSRQLLNVQDPHWGQVKDTVSWINEESSFLSFQLRNIFAAAEFEAGTMQSEFGRVKVNEVWSKVCTPYLNTIHRGRIKVACNGDFMLPQSYRNQLHFSTDAHLLQLIIANLFDNAIKAAPHDSRVEVNFEVKDQHLTIVVSDQGAGIDEADQSRVFDRFRQLDSSTTKPFRGMGLGLSLVAASCDLIGGDVSIDCQAGKGTKFTVVLQEIENNEHADSSLDNMVFFDDEDFGEEEVV